MLAKYWTELRTYGGAASGKLSATASITLFRPIRENLGKVPSHFLVETYVMFPSFDNLVLLLNRQQHLASGRSFMLFNFPFVPHTLIKTGPGLEYLCSCMLHGRCFTFYWSCNYDGLLKYYPPNAGDVQTGTFRGWFSAGGNDCEIFQTDIQEDSIMPTKQQTLCDFHDR